MAIPWLSVLQMVPWNEVIRNAPKVAESAKKLWTAVAKKSPAAASAVNHAQPALSSEAQSIASLEAQLADLQRQMLASSELIKTLADQNTQLIERIEANRIRTAWLVGAMVVLALTEIFLLVAH